MSDEKNEKLETVGLKLNLALAGGFNCHVCSSTSFSYNGMGLVFCEECGITYHVDVIKTIYT